MNISIRKRMFLIIVAMAVPMSMFTWLLMGEVNKQIDFAEQEKKGVELQKPLVQLLHAVHARKLAVLSGAPIDGADASVAEHKAALDKVFSAVSGDVGFGDAKWQALKTTLDADIAALSTADAAAHAKAAASVRAVISRSSDGSNLTLDPDLDSYYTMDANSFAIPSAVDNLGAAEEELLAIAAARSSSLSAEQYARVENWKYIIATVDGGRVMGSLGVAFTEDLNFFGDNKALMALKPLASAYEGKNGALLEVLEQFKKTDKVSAKEMRAAFTDARSALMALSERTPDAMESLLDSRVADLQSHKQNLLMEGGVAILVGLAMFWFVSNGIVTPINRLRAAMSRLAKGDLSVEVPYMQRRDEIGQMANAVVVFKQNAQHIHSMASKFESSVKHVVEVVASAATEMDASSQSLTQQSKESHHRLETLASDLKSASGNMQTVSTAGDQLYAAINEISSQVHKAASTNNTAVEEAANVKKVAESLSEAAQKVSGIVGIINAIASKITLLALNATIESARAGEAGKGFAVVASEVKTLAAQTANATAEISQLVSVMQNSSKETLDAITTITSVIEQLNLISNTIAAAVEEQGMATKEIAGHIKQATDRMDSVNKNTGMITQSVAQSAAAASQTQQASGELSKQSEHLRSEVGNFLRTLTQAA